MTLIHAIILGIVQGLTEFIPISSSAHLLLLPWFFGWKPHSINFDVALHLGTTIALVAYFGKDWGGMIASFFKGCRRRGDAACENPQSSTGYMVIPIILACVPAAVVGILFEDTLEATVRKSPLCMAAMLAVMGIVMYLAELSGKKKRGMESMNGWDWVTIGLAQALALVPGVSRSGATISMGLFRNLSRDAAARFSFLLSAPIIFGASGIKLLEIARDGMPKNEIVPFIIGVITSTIVGYIAIAFLMNYVRKHSLGLFVWYRIGLAALITVVYLFGVR